MRGIVAPVFGLLAVACVVFGALNATIWRPSSEIAASAKVSGRYAMTDPGVLSMVAERSTLVVHTNSSKTRVCIALSTRKDAAGWLAGSKYTRITGMSDWQTLTTSAQKASGSSAAQDSAVEFESSDMWRSVKCGTGNVSLTSRATSSDVIALIDTGSNSARTSVTVHWVRVKLPDFATPFYFIAALLALMTVLSASVFAMPDTKRRKVPGEPKPKDPDEISFSEALAGSLNIIKRTFAPRKSNKPRKRHAQGASAQSAAESSRQEENQAGDTSPAEGNGLATSEPVVVDPMSRNLVADMQQRVNRLRRIPRPSPSSRISIHATPGMADSSSLCRSNRNKPRIRMLHCIMTPSGIRMGTSISAAPGNLTTTHLPHNRGRRNRKHQLLRNRTRQRIMPPTALLRKRTNPTRQYSGMHVPMPRHR